MDKGKKNNPGSFIAYLLDKEDVKAYITEAPWIDIGDEIKKGNVTI